MHAMAPIRKPSAAMDGRRVAMDPSILDAYVENRPWNTMTGGSVGGGEPRRREPRARHLCQLGRPLRRPAALFATRYEAAARSVTQCLAFF